MLPFYIGKAFGASYDTQGTAFLKDEGVRLVFCECDDDGEILDDNVDQILVRWDALEEIELDHGFLESKVKVKASFFEGFGSLPGWHDGELELQVNKRDRKTGDAFMKKLDKFRKGYKRPDVDSILDDTRKFLEDL